MTLAWVLLNLAYVAYIVSPMLKEIFALRVVLLIATAFFIAYGIADGIWSVVWWNIAFGAAHVWQLGKLIQERRAAALTDEEEAIRTLLFPTLDRVDFVRFWNEGVEQVRTDEVLATPGEPLDELMLIMDGEVEVMTADDVRVRLRKFSLIGEMSFVSGDLPNAEVRCRGEVVLRSWPLETITELCAERPQVSTALLATVSRDLSEKLRNPGG